GLVAGFPGTVILVSHDRDFLDRTVTDTIVPEGDGRWTEYAGGYSDMLAQRGGSRLEDRKRNAKSPVRADKDKTPDRDRKEPSRKLSYKQKFALENLPKKIASAVEEISELEAKLADPDFYARDPAGFAKTAAILEAKRAEHGRMEEEWLELELLREEVEGG